MVCYCEVEKCGVLPIGLSGQNLDIHARLSYTVAAHPFCQGGYLGGLLGRSPAEQQQLAEEGVLEWWEKHVPSLLHYTGA